MLSSRVFACTELRSVYPVYPESRRELPGEPRSSSQNSRLPLSIPTTAAICPSLSRHSSTSLSPFKINTYKAPHKCCIQRTYRIAKLFRINTYKKHGGRGVLWLTRNPIRISILLALSFEGSDQRESKDLSSQPTSGFALPTLFSLFAPRVFHNSFAIKPFHTLSENCRVSPTPRHPFLKDYFNCGRISGEINHLQVATEVSREKSLPPLSTLNCRLSTVSSRPSMLPMVPVIRRRGDAHAPKLIAIILLKEHVPLFAALEDFLLVRRNLLADIQLHFLFFLQRGRQDQHHLLPDGVPVVHKFHVVARHQHFRNLVRQSHNLFPAKSHPPSFFTRLGEPINLRDGAGTRASSHFHFSNFHFLPQDQFAIPRQLLLRFLVHLLVRNARAPHLVLMHDQELPHFLVEPVFDGEFF